VHVVDAPLALYRRYRPETFADVIGQAHIAEPLRHALANNRFHHAYLFSGPRGCGKTTSARILARTLNCEKAPIADPCGECQSCRDLARGGPGSMDVIEIDAASHGGVDDARDLRERAFFSPVSSRYKVYIIDEAHMVSNQGFNALLKLVEEPPPHLKFIFATTEPDKVISTIRSRTHHYPFRLVPPKVLGDYLTSLCEAESVRLEPTALPLVVRAGAGSVRDTLSVLDQLLGGAGPDGVTYELAAALLGYTPDSLLDEVVDAFAAGDGGSVFGVVDKVVETGQDPRRFAADLLQRLRDLVIVSAVPGAVSMGLLEIPGDRAERLENQASRFGASDLTRAADVVGQGLTELRGATAPRLLLELMCARILLPGADHSTSGFQARLDRIERRLSITGAATDVADTTTTPAAAPSASWPTPSSPDGPVRASDPAGGTLEEPVAPAPPADVQPVSEPEVSERNVSPAVSERNVSPAAAEPPDPPPPAATGAIGVTDLRRLWPEVLDRVMVTRRFAWIMLSQNAQVHSVDGAVITIALVNAGARDSFARSGSDDVLRAAIVDVIGGDWRIETIVDPGTSPSPAGTESRSTSAATTTAPQAQNPATPERPSGGQSASTSCSEPRAAGSAQDADVDPDDPVVETVDVSHEDLLSDVLGAKVIEDHPPRP